MPTTRIETSLQQAEEYVDLAKASRANDPDEWNPVVVNCIMALIKTIDALMLENRDRTVQDHSKTARELTKLYEDDLISTSFKSNIDSVRKWVVDKKTSIQYRDEQVSKSDADRAIKAAERLLKKAKRELS